MSKKRVNLITAVNSANVSKSGDVYTVRDVVHAIDGIVLNKRLYTGKELKKGVPSLEKRPAPAGHPKDHKGRHISASNGEALGASWIGAWCTNSRYEGSRALCDITINAVQAAVMPAGKEVIARLDAAIAGTNTDPIAVSSGLLLEEVEAAGESLGKPYTSVATNMQFDHLAILLNETPAGTPAEGVGMFINSQGEEEEIETVSVNTDPVDLRSAGLLKWVKRLVGNGDISFDQITDSLRMLLPEDSYPREVFDNYLVWSDYKHDKLWRQDYAVRSDGSVAFTTDPVEVIRKVEYQPISTNSKDDQVKEIIIAALNAAGISGVAAMTDAQLLSSFEAVKAKPHTDALAAVNEKLVAANSQIAGFEAQAVAATNAERDGLAVKLAANSSLTADDFKAMPLARLKELDAKAAPVVIGNQSTQTGDEFAGYDLNKQGV